MTPEELKQNSQEVKPEGKPIDRRGFLKLAGITLTGILTGTIFRSKEAIEAVIRPENPIHFINRLGEQAEWFVYHGTSGIPPNDPDRPTDTVYVSINSIYSYLFQTKNSLYPEVVNGTATRAAIDAVLVDTTTWKGYMATVIIIDNIAYQRIELISDANNPLDYSDEARLVFKDDVVGNIAQVGDLGNFYMGQDTQGKYLDLVIIHAVVDSSRTPDPSKNGTYRIRLNSQGNFSGSFIKIASTEPTPTPTIVPPTATPPPTPALTRRSLLPFIMQKASWK